MDTNLVRTFYDIFFSVFPFPFFRQLLDLWAAFNNAFYGLFGIDVKFIGF